MCMPVQQDLRFAEIAEIEDAIYYSALLPQIGIELAVTANVQWHKGELSELTTSAKLRFS